MNILYKPRTGIESVSAEIKNHGYLSAQLSLGEPRFFSFCGLHLLPGAVLLNWTAAFGVCGVLSLLGALEDGGGKPWRQKKLLEASLERV